MLGLSVEKIVVIVLVAAVVVGPQRLPRYVEKLVGFVNGARHLANGARVRAESATGVPFDATRWNLTQYDPRRIIRGALDESDAGDLAPMQATTAAAYDDAENPGAGRRLMPPEHVIAGAADGAVLRGAQADPSVGASEAQAVSQPAGYIIAGSSGHPRRIPLSVSLSSVDGQGDGELRAASIASDAHLSAMSAHDRFDDRGAEASAAVGT